MKEQAFSSVSSDFAAPNTHGGMALSEPSSRCCGLEGKRFVSILMKHQCLSCKFIT